MRSGIGPTIGSSFSRRTALLCVAVLIGACGGGPSDEEGATTEDAPTDAAASATEEGAAATDDMDAAMADDDHDEMAGDEMADGEHDEMADDDHDMGGAAAVGAPAPEDEATRVIQVTVGDELAFRPSTFEVSAGEVVTFEVTNEGSIEHEFVLGDEQMQQAMAEEMAEGDDHAHGGGMSNAVTVHGGETGLLTWRFGEPGTVLVGCHVPGHYDAGMRGTVTVTAG